LSRHSSRGSMIRKCAAWAKDRIPARGSEWLEFRKPV
jgi:hypothetical protein